MLRKFALTIGVLAAGAPSLQELPADLRTLADTVGCGPVPGFFERPGMVDPPFLYGVQPGPREESAAFWCATETSPRYRLVVVGQGAVVAVIEWQHYPGGFSLAERADWDVGDFRYVTAPEQYGPRGMRTEFAPLWSEYDGAVTMFYRHEGRWLFRMLH